MAGSAWLSCPSYWTRSVSWFLFLLTVPGTCFAWNLTLQLPDLVTPCNNFTAKIGGDGGAEPFTLALVPFLNSSLKVMEYNFTSKSAPLTVVIPYPGGTTVIPIARDASSTAYVSNSFTVFYNRTNFTADCSSASRSTDFSFTVTPQNPIIGEPTRLAWNAAETIGNTTFFVVTPAPNASNASGTLFDIPGERSGNASELDWIPSIAPNQQFVIVASDSRGTGSGGTIDGTTIDGTTIDGTTQSGDMVCAFGVSDQYSVMQRCLFYLLLLSGLFLHNFDWLTGPLLGAAMAVSTSVAFHAIVLSKANTGALAGTFIDLDSLATFQILVVCIYGSMPFIIISRRARRTPIYFILIMSWAIICFAAMFCAISAADVPVATCMAYTGNTTAGTTTGVNVYLCTDICPQLSSPIRNLGSAAPVLLHQLQYTSAGMNAARIVGSCLGAWTLGVGYLRMRNAFKPSEREAREGDTGLSCTSSWEKWHSIARGSIIRPSSPALDPLVVCTILLPLRGPGFAPLALDVYAAETPPINFLTCSFLLPIQVVPLMTWPEFHAWRAHWIMKHANSSCFRI
ncbi:hypothetical protein MVEN_02336700 [Mycena venus]|uniref:Uncharacterized protein n=1 Tax=Mycena venus TaxID=2733690 RepID=A0A8H6X4D0_9AGAR|nr:hypothetical protein MVEN_02336700 [Mycena venus]